jgi:hypothetical protein
MSANLIQGRHGTKGNFELVVQPSHGEGLMHYWRNNDGGTLPWNGPTCLGERKVRGASLIQGNYGPVGNLEVVTVDDGGDLASYWRRDGAPWTWSGPSIFAHGFRGVPSLIQSRHGVKGNFEVVVPLRDGCLAHLWRNNDDPAMPWSGPSSFGDTALYDGAALIQSNYGAIGNLEVVAVRGDELVFFWRMDGPPWTWSGPHRIASDVRGAPSLIQGRHGTRGNFEVVVAHRDGGLVHLWRNNDDPACPWSAPLRFGDGRLYDAAAVIQGNFGTVGNLEVVAIDSAGKLAVFWRQDGPPWSWNGPFPVGVERQRSVSECVYGWTSAYQQADTDVAVRIQFNPDAGVSATTLGALWTTWRSGIIDKWSNRFDCQAPNGERTPITFDVLWVSADAHHVVRVRPGPERSDMTTWDTSDSGDVASHEFGHMLGLPDEYADAACPARSPVGTGTVMADNTEAVARHVNEIAAFHCGHTPADRPGEPIVEVSRMRMLEQLVPSARAAFFDTIKRAATGAADDSEASQARVVLTISGGPPSERYEQRLEVRADGIAETSFVDELHNRKTENVRADVGRDAATEVFRRVLDVGLLDVPRITEKPVPDALILTVSVISGEIAKLVQAPVFERETAGAKTRERDQLALVVGENLVISRAAASPSLLQVLETLSAIQEKLRQ